MGEKKKINRNKSTISRRKYNIGISERGVRRPLSGGELLQVVGKKIFSRFRRTGKATDSRRLWRLIAIDAGGNSSDRIGPHGQKGGKKRRKRFLGGYYSVLS